MRRDNQRGIALVMVMMAVLALTILTVEFVYSTHVQYDMALNMKERLQAEYMAKSGIQMALLVVKFQKQLDSVQSRVGDNATIMSSGPLYKQIPIDTMLLRAALGLGSQAGMTFSEEDRRGLGQFLDFPGNFTAKIDDEQGKINLNALANTSDQGAQGSTGAAATPTPGASPTPPPRATPTPGTTGETGQSSVSQVTIEQLKALLEPDRYDALFTQGEDSREDVIYNLLDWVDADQQRSGSKGGFEDSVYAQKDPPYHCKNAKFDTIDEIALVDGVNQEFIDTFRSSLTIYGPSNRININAAERTLLTGVVGRLIKSKNEQEIEQIVDWIDENRNFKKQSEFLEGMKTLFGYESADLDPVMLGSLVFQSSVFSITSTGSIGDEGEGGGAPRSVKVTIHMVVMQANQNSRAQNFSRSAQLPGGLQVLYWRVE